MKPSIFKRNLTILLILFAQMGLLEAAFGANNQQDANVKVDSAFYHDIKSVISEGFIDEVDNEKFIYDSLNGGLQGIDPHSSYIKPKDYIKFKESVNGEFSGIGVQITNEHGFVKVISPIDGTPAFKAGIKSGDYITHINGENIYQFSTDEASMKIKGKEGTKVKVTVLRIGEENPLEFNIVREKIKAKSVTVKYENNIAIVRVSSFMQTTANELKKELTNLKDLKGIIIDLRNNPGGILDQAILISNLFLEKDQKIVSVKGRRKEFYRAFKENGNFKMPMCFAEKSCININVEQKDGETTFKASGEGAVFKNIPIVTLINKASASASEIVSGALKDNRRSIIVGEVSFGKGVVQSVLPIKGGEKGALKLTTSRYYSPSGESIQAAGIIPNIIAPQGKIVAEENKLQNLFFEREGDLKNHAVGEQLEEIAKKSKKYEAQKNFSKSHQNDYQMMTAINVLTALMLTK